MPKIAARLLLGLVILTIALLLTNPQLLPKHALFHAPGGKDVEIDWPIYGGTDGQHYSPLTQINRQNVAKLTVAWSFNTHEEGGLQTSPLVIHGVLYGITPLQRVFALDAASGKLIWRFDSGILGTQPNRGLAYYEEKNNRQILVGVMNYLYALNADTGKPVLSFGKQGRIDLRENLGREPVSEQSVYLTSPGVIYKDLIIVGGRDPETLPAPPGDIRAFDVHTGKLRWAFHTIPHPGEPGYETWPKNAWKTSGAANNWTGMTLDTRRGIVYVPTGSPAFDFYGGDRVGDNLFADCLLALDAATGKKLWHFQAVRHDIWDRDFPSPPVLLTLTRNGQVVDAVAQPTKQGFVYVFDRQTGKPLFPITSHSYLRSDVPGERTAPQQVLPTSPEPFARQDFSEDLLTRRTPKAHAWALAQFRQFRSAGQFVPFTLGKSTVLFPGFDGGAEWGGPAVDPESGTIYVNANDVAWTGELAANTGEHTPRGIYLSQCGVCHGEQLKGSPPEIPSLQGIGKHLKPAEIASVIRSGRGRMQGFPNLSDDEISTLVSFVTEGENPQVSSAKTGRQRIKYLFTGYKKFLDPDGYPAVAPPWGTLNAINLNTAKYTWKIPLGEYPELAAEGKRDTGTENYGGPLVTAGGLLFIGATNFDHKFRAFDKGTGKLLWETTLPFSGNATPITYSMNRRQFVVIAAGGGKDPKVGSGGIFVAFSLPK